MEIVIDIPKEMMSYINKNEFNAISEAAYGSMAMLAIKNGTPLPKGHGRLIDEKDILDTENNSGGWYDLVDMPEYIAGVKAIIEADKED